MSVYVGIDVHRNRSQVAVIDEAMHQGGKSGVVQLMPAGDVELQEQ
jgi:hypothetical protein